MVVLRDAAVAVGIYTMGDVVAQQVEHGSIDSVASVSAERMASASALGLLWGGGISPGVYRLVEQQFPGRHPRDVLKKIACCTVLLGCVGNWSQIFVKRILAGDCTSASAPMREQMRATAQSVNDDWLTVMSYDLRVWPLTDVLVFALIPIRFRVAFVSTVSTCWQTYLSYTASQGTAPGGGALRRTLSGNCRVL